MNQEQNSSFLTSEQKAQIISESLPYLRTFNSKIFVIKYGGASMLEKEAQKKVLEDIAFLYYAGIKIVLLHGGGPEINLLLEKLEIKSEFRDGLRVTSQRAMEVVEMVLTGKVQKKLVGLLNQAGARAVGISGKDSQLILAEKIKTEDFDWGFTGKVKTVNINLVKTLLEANYLPVVSSIAGDESGESYNLNADFAAASLAVALKAEKLILLTNTDGILQDPQDSSSLIKRIKLADYQELIKNKTVKAGMIPKLTSAVKSVEQGVNSAHILNGTKEHALLLEIFTQSGIGTMIK